MIPFEARRSGAIAACVAAHTGQEDRIFLHRFGGTDVFHLSGRLSNNGICGFVDMCEDNVLDRDLAAAKVEIHLRREEEPAALQPSPDPRRPSRTPPASRKETDLTIHLGSPHVRGSSPHKDWMALLNPCAVSPATST